VKLIFYADLTRRNNAHAHDDHEFMKVRAIGYWRKAAVVSWFVSMNFSMQ
jgi:hypothetical protein